MRLKSSFVLAGLSILSVTALARAQSRSGPRIDEAILGRFDMPSLERGRPRMRDELAVLIELHRERDADALRPLEAKGVRLNVVGGRLVRWRTYVSARVTRQGLAALSESALVASVRLADLPVERPLSPSSSILGVEAARAVAASRESMTGAGVTVADIDTALDYFHPAFFRGDAGWFDWIDVDGDGVLRPGVDAIDLDADGEADASEIARVLRAEPVAETDGAAVSGFRPDGFDPAYDWLYLDDNDNGARDFGADFDESTPAYGEPLFTPDDVNGNGRLDANERLVRLGTSKVRRYLVQRYNEQTERNEMFEFARGENLIEARLDYTGGQYGYSDTMHATGVLGIVAADLPLTHRAWTGIAPDVDLVLVFDATTDRGAALTWTLQQEPDVVLHEYVYWATVEMDGSDSTSRMMDDSTDEGVVHVCPAGNIGAAGKHMQIDVPPGDTVVATLSSPSQQFIMFSLMSSAPNLVFELLESDDTAHTFASGTLQRGLSTGGTLYGQRTRTSRGFNQVDGYIIDAAVPGTFRFRVTNNGTAVARVHGFEQDSDGFGGSTMWEDADPASTLSWPATADSCIAVGAAAAFDDSEINDISWYPGTDRSGDLRDYSSRGPRVDGELRPHVLAPDNPFSTAPHGEVYPSEYGIAPYPVGAYALFGGTSGAGPHVAATAALLVQKGLRGSEVRDVIVDHAAPIPGAPNSDVGHGLVDTAAAIGTSRDNEPPSVTLRLDGSAFVGSSASVVAEASDADGDALEVRWDDGYDGSFETDFAALAPHAMTLDRVGTYRIKARVRDATGRIAEAALVFEATEAPHDDGGCDCGVAGSAPSRSTAWLAGLVSLALLRRRRRVA